MKVARVPVLILTGSMGAGKTTVLWEAHDLLKVAKVPHAALDVDGLSIAYPGEDPYSLIFANLAAMWPNYASAGADRLLLAVAVEDASDLGRYRAAVPGAEITVCRLVAPTTTTLERVRAREIGMLQAEIVANAVRLDGVLDRAGVEDFSVRNDGSRGITEVAREVLQRAGWLP